MKNQEIFIGLMSGTSMDGVDASALLVSKHKKILSEFNEERHLSNLGLEENLNEYISELGNFYLPYPQDFKINGREAERIMQSSSGSIKSKEQLEFIQNFERELTYFHIDAVVSLIKQLSLNKSEITAIGFHGQTLYHNPLKRITIQVGDGALMARQLGIDVINDFRSLDVANGGQGAPLVPIFHFMLCKQRKLIPNTIINCGGIANITIIPSSEEKDILGFDSGPGNVLIDRYLRIKTGEFADIDGKYGLLGKVNMGILEKLFQMSAAYLEKKHPKSLCSSDMHLPDGIFDISIYDACHTLEIFTAETIYMCCPRDIENFVLVGGGWHNPVISNHFKNKVIENYNSPQFLSPKILGWNLDSMEAGAFAYFAYRNLSNLPISFPNVTGVEKPIICGVKINA